MLFHIATALTLLALVAGMYLLAKTKAEGLGKFFNFVSWFIIVISGLMLIFSIVHACLNMCGHHRGMMIEKEYIMHGGGPGMEHHGMMRGDEDCCEGGEDMDCCRRMMDKEGMDHHKGMKEREEHEEMEKADTTKH